MALACFVAWAGPAAAADAPKKIQAVGSTFPKVVEQSEDGTVSGYAHALAQAILETMEIELEIDVVPFKRALHMVKTGSASLMVSLFRNPERETYLDFGPQAHTRHDIVFYAAPGERPVWAGDLSALSGRWICSMRGWSQGDVFDSQVELFQIVEIPTLESGFRMLEAERCELFVSNRTLTDPVLESLDGAIEAEVLDPPISSALSYFGFSKGWRPDLQERFNEIFEEMVRDGRMAALAERYQVNLPAAAGGD